MQIDYAICDTCDTLPPNYNRFWAEGMSFYLRVLHQPSRIK